MEGVWQTTDPKRAEGKKTNPVTGEKKMISPPRNTHRKDRTEAALLCAPRPQENTGVVGLGRL